MRSNAAVFRNPALFQQMLADEAQAGWQLAEKLDAARVRLRRPVAERLRTPRGAARSPPTAPPSTHRAAEAHGRWR